ncbi:MAG: gamma-glutamyltransferase [Rhodospirillales bacterium]|jgi:gamma-glutamyltranspeptidase/glutathione hydrolase|nr:gamma-glutamyltransferase [Rhodospirillales bacterium]MDP6773022.1 gamma-glutamyltransferase [Rhodospirillales bacterium]
MLQSTKTMRGMVVSSHHLAAEAGLGVLREGGNAIEAMIAAAAAISVVYPHMNGLGGDGFWLISEPGRRPPRAINAVGAAAGAADAAFFRGQGADVIPSRGPLAANTAAGTISGWQDALEISAEWGGKLPLSRLLEDAAYHAGAGFPVTESQNRHTTEKLDELKDVPGWADVFLDGGTPWPVGSLFKQPALADTLERMAKAGLDDFYRGELARRLGADLERAGSPVRAEDLARQRAVSGEPLSVKLGAGKVYNVTPPSQGLASLIILGLFDRLGWCTEADGFAHVHGVVEASKRAVLVRNAHVTDPAHMAVQPEDFLTDAALDEMAGGIDAKTALPWPVPSAPGDTVWLGAIDGKGRVVSFIHSIYWEFGSGVVLRDTGVQWQNRGSSFSLEEGDLNPISPGRLPFHTNNPAMAILDDGRVMAYGTMGGEGQPQTQAALFTRYVHFAMGLQRAITAPRWVLARTWGAERTDLRVESRMPADVVEALRAAGHDVTVVGPFEDAMGHAGAAVLHASGVMEGATDPRCDGAVAAF